MRLKNCSIECLFFTERAKGIEPSSPAWEAGVIAIIRRPQNLSKISNFSNQFQE